MRNFHAYVDLSCSFEVPLDTKFSDSSWLNYQKALLITMGSEPGNLSTSEEAILADFTSWFLRAKEDELMSVFPRRPVFFYANLNEGYNVVFVIVDHKGKTHLSQA
jgi:hypothetical protein